MSVVTKLEGRRFGRLLVLKRAGSNKQGRAVWECLCDCGKTRLITGNRMLTKNTTSCGCFQRERKIEELRKNPPNLGKYRIAPGEYGFNHLLCGYKTLARKRNIDFLLTEEEFRVLTKSNCHYCNTPPMQIANPIKSSYKYEATKQRAKYTYNGIDRVNSNFDYTIDNCVACCKFCNLAKCDNGIDEFLAWIKRVGELKK